MSTIRQELQNYLASTYPQISIDTEHTLCGKVTIRFNATEDEFPEAPGSIDQSVERGSSIFRTLFEKKDQPLWIIAYEYLGEELINYEAEYLFKQFTPERSRDFVTKEEMVNSRMIMRDENGNDTFHKTMARISIGRASLKEINIEAILRGIAGRDHGLDPVIGQTVYFFDPVHHTGFHMYDDRGFFAWATEVEKLRNIYTTYNNWITDYTREDLDEFFL